MYSFFPSSVRFFPSSSIMDQNWPFRLNPKGEIFSSYSTPFFLFLNSTMMSIKPTTYNAFQSAFLKWMDILESQYFMGLRKTPSCLKNGFPIATTYQYYVHCLDFPPFLYVEEYLMRSNKIYGTENTWMNCIVSLQRRVDMMQ